MDMTLREIGNTFGVSRRAVQGYEKVGLISASGKNERGHLLYDEVSQERIRRIKLFQQMGFTVKEIRDIIDAPDDILKAVLENQAKKMKEQIDNMEIMIGEVYGLIKNL